MTPPLAPFRTRLARRRRQHGMTFAEIMFAVMLLGIGFIMIAGVFPVAIQQTQTTVQETAGANIAQDATRIIATLAKPGDFESGNDEFKPLRDDNDDPLYARIGSSFINAQDSRFAWTALYRKKSGTNYIQTIILGARVRNRDRFDLRDVQPYGDLPPNLYPRPLVVENLTDADPDDPNAPIMDMITFRNPDTDEETLAVAGLGEGTLIVLAQGDQTITDDHGNARFVQRAGRVYRLGKPVDPASDLPRKWYLVPGGDVSSPYEQIPGNGVSNVKAWCLGKSYDYDNPDGGFSGEPMDIDAYSTFILVPKTSGTP